MKPTEAAAKAINQNAAAASQPPQMQRPASWSVEKKKTQAFLEKFPWLLPTLLIVIIAAALISIPFSLGLFK